MTDKLIEAMAIAVWRQDAERAAPNVAKLRTRQTWAELSELDQAIWTGFATAAYNALRAELVPMGWQYDRLGFHTYIKFPGGRSPGLVTEGWTETKLYALPEIKP